MSADLQRMGRLVLLVLALSVPETLPFAEEVCEQVNPSEQGSALFRTGRSRSVSEELVNGTSDDVRCWDFARWPDVDKGVTCGEGSCLALVNSRNYGNKCDTYCESFGHTCVAAYEEKRDTCEVKKVYGCGDVIPQTSDILCKCSLIGDSPPPTEKPSPTPSPSPSPGPATCWDFSYWPDLDGVTCGEGTCMALVQSENYGGRCDRYCESFGHTCAAAYEEKDDTCEIKQTHRCDETINGTSDILCKCIGDGSRPPVPGAPGAITVVETPCVNLMLVADHGSKGSLQRQVAAGMARAAQKRSPVAIAGVGDNIYNDGAEGQPSRIVRYWKDVYLKHEALKLPWYMVTGNHDWHSDARVERDFTNHSSNTGGLWRMPGFWYKHTFRSDASGLVVDAFFIDTMIWMGSRKVTKYVGSMAMAEQKLWLESELQKSTADWKIVLGHHPVYSRGSHGVTRELFNDLDPIMRRHGVQAMVAGHDHSKHLIQYEGFSYIVNGAGGKTPRTPSDEYPSGSLVRDHQDPGFATMKLCKDTPGELVFFDSDGASQSSSQIPKEAPTAALSGDVRLATGKYLQFPAQAQMFMAGPERRCGGHVMREVDKFCKSMDGSGCRVVADQSSKETCESYCKMNGLACKNGWTQEDEDCQPTVEVGCQEGSDTIDNMICECGPH